MLASLELFGFKSFAERTSFDFDPGVTAVVGPNGSGKSNVVDAIKWVLGDQSAKSLRGKEMTDVIFNGATGRKPSNFAEATLAFDNTSGFLPTNDRQVRVGRRLWRNGDSEYLLNDQVVRLKDVRDLFMGTGAGASAYAIIEQGRVDQILQANAIGRRAVFEEAAGISRYKAKKNDALRRLERVEQNLLRLTDIVDEVEAQLHATRTQAAKAAAHRDATKELERWWLGMAADDYRHNAGQLTALRQTLAERQGELEKCQVEQTELDEQVAGLDAELASADAAHRAAEGLASATREAIAGHEATRRYQSDRAEELSQDLGRLRHQVTLLSSRDSEGRHEHADNLRLLAATRDDLSQKRSGLAEREAELDRYITEIESRRAQIADCRERQMARMRNTAEEESRIAALLAEREGLRNAIDDLDGRLANILVELIAAAETADDEQAAVNEAEAVVRIRQGRAGDLREARERLAADRESLAASVATYREKKSATAARIAVLEDLQNRGEGFGIGVREILRRARSLGNAPWNQIHGTVADLLDVDLDDAPLLEIALGHRAQLVVVENFDALLPYLGRSSATISGRVGFLSNQGLPESAQNELAGVRYIEANPPDRGSGDHLITDAGQAAYASELIDPWSIRRSLHGLPGVQKRADELIRPSSRMPHLARRLLHDTWIVTDLATALRLAAGHGRGQRFVTQGGELLDADGTLVVGTLRAEAAVVSRRSELIRLRAELLEYDRAIAEILERQVELDESQTSLTETLTSADAELRDAIDQFNRARSAQAQAEARRRGHDGDRIRLEQELAARKQSLAALEERLAAARTEQEATQAELVGLKANLEQSQHELVETEKRQNECEETFATDRLELAKAEERVKSLEDAARRLERDIQQRDAQRAEAIRRLDLALTKHSETICYLLNTQALHAEAYLEKDRHATAVWTAAARRDALKGRRGRFSERESALAGRRRSLGDAVHNVELAIRERENQLANVAERIREEFSRELPELAETEHSAISLWVEEREGKGREGEAERGGAGAGLASFTIPPYLEIRGEFEARVERLRKKLRLMGAVNADSLADLDELEERHARLSGQLQDLVEAKRTLEDLIRRINTESKRMFLETFESIRENFKDLFRKLFGGGEGDIVLEDARDVLDCGIDIVARPPGKELRSLSLLSGGEKTMTCVGLLLAIFKSKPSPFCLLDEVDAALDEANIGRFVGVLKEFKATTQFIMITHRKPSMCEADVLYGVTMEQAGVSKRLNVRFDDIAEDGNFKNAGRRRAA